MKQVHDHEDALKAAESYFDELTEKVDELESEVESLQHRITSPTSKRSAKNCGRSCDEQQIRQR
jgi:peptidoglycan hydrolase CwlO-like protein